MLVEDDGLDEGWHDEEEGEDDDIREGLEMISFGGRTRSVASNILILL